MAMEVILSTVYLDVYDHDTTPSTIKTIALDSQTRYVEAYLKKNDENYNPDLSSVVTLTAIRPDKVGAESVGTVKLLVPGTEDREETTYDEDGNPVTVIIPGEPAVYGLEAEITQAMIAVPGTVLFQFKMEVDNKVLRTEIFRSNNGRALDGEASSWADTYQGYNLDDFAERIDTAERSVAEIGETVNNVENEFNTLLENLNGQDIGFIELSDVEIIDGSYLDANGETASNASFRLSDYIEIPWGTKNVVLNRLIWVDDTSYPQTHVVWFYDSEKTLLGTGYGEIRTNTTLIATPYPSAKYMRANFSKAHAVPFILRNATDALRCSRFTFNEIGITDLNDLERNYIYLRASASGSAVAHLPYNNWIGTVMTINAPNQLSGSIQLAYSSTGRFHYRVCWGVNNTWTDWVEFLQKSNLNYAMGELGRYTGAFTQREQLTAPIYLQPNHKYLVKFFNNDRTGSINVFPTLNTSNYKRVMPWMDEAVITTADDGTVRYLNFYNPNSQLDRVDIAVYELDSPFVCVEDKPRIYRVNKDERMGDFTSITECFLALKDDDRPKIIEIWEGDYDIYQEYVDADVPVYTGDNPSMDYFDYCVWVPKNSHVIGKGIVRLKWTPDPSEVSITAMQTRCVSPLNVAGSATIENLEVYCQNGRYVLHNDALGKPEYTGAKQHYINCRFYKYEDAVESGSGYRYGFGHTTGFGIDRAMSHIYENCLFKNFYTGRAFYGHSRGSVITDENCNSDITLRDCVIETEGTTCIKFGNGTNNLTHIRTTFSGCYINGLIDCMNESGTPTYPNAYDIRFLNCGNVRLHIADEDNRYAPSAYNTVLSME